MSTPSKIQAFLDAIGGMDVRDFGREWFNAGLSSSFDVVRVRNQAEADQRIPGSLRATADLRVVWAELREFVDFTPWLKPWHIEFDAEGGRRRDTHGIDWLILSGSPDSPTDLDGLRRVIADCKAAGVPVFVRNIGAKPRTRHGFWDGDTSVSWWDWLISDPTGSDPAEWPVDLRVREVPAMLKEGM